MGTASRNVSSKAIRMLPKSDAAHYCGRPIKRFEAECPVVPVRFPNGDLRWDVQELDGWIDNLKAGNVGSSHGDPGEARMTRIRVRGFQIFKDRHGTWRCYHRATRTPVDLTAAPIGSAEFFAECSRTAALSTAGGQSKAGTLGILISEYRAHSAFTCDIAARTRSDYQRVFDHLQPLSDTPLVRFDAPSVIQIRDLAARQHGRRFGNYVKQVLSLTFAWGIARHTVATILAEMGYDDRTIADMLGQKTLTMAQHYSRRADRSRKMTSVVANFDAELNRRSDTLWARLSTQESLSEERPLET